MEFRAPGSTTGSAIVPNINLQGLLNYPSSFTVFFTGVQKQSNPLLSAGRLPDSILNFGSQGYSYISYDGNSLYTLSLAPGRTYPTLTQVSIVTHRQSSGSFDCYINGVPQIPTAGANASLASGLTVISGIDGSNNFWSGSLGAVLVYNRALTDDEIWQNTQVLAPRYGISLPSNKPYSPLDPHAYLFLSQSRITDPIITSSIDTFVRGLKSASLWDKLFAIYPFVGTGSVGTNLTGSHVWNLKEPSSFTYGLVFSGSWNGSTSGSAPSGSNTYISAPNLQPGYTDRFSVPMPINRSNVHISILSYDTPTSSSYLMGTGMTEDLAVSTLAGDYGTPAAAYSVRKVRTAYSGALMDVRRSIDNVTSSIGYVSNGDLDTGSLLTFVGTGPDDHGFVARWYDQSGNSRHASQTATGSQPLIVLSGSVILDNSKPALDFDGVNDFYNFPNLTPTSNDSIFLLGRRKTNSSNGIFLSNTGSSFPYRVGHFNNDEYQYQAAGYKLYGLSNTANQDLISAFANGYGSTGFLLYVNSIQPTLLEYGTSGYQTPWNSIGSSNAFSNAYAQEILVYSSNQINNREPIEYGINSYYNIYPQTSSFATSSFTIKADSGSISGSLNNKLTSGIASSGPLGLITVSRTGSNSLTIARNGVTSSFAVPASGALLTGIYLGAINNNGLAVGSSPYNISFASIGTGLTNTEVRTYTNLTSKLALDLQRASVLDLYPNARSAYSVRKLSKNYTGSALEVIRTSDNAVADIGFNGFNLDTTALLNFVGTGTSNHGYVRTWYDQSGFNNHVTQSTHTAGANVAIVLSGSLVTQGTKPALYMNGTNMVGTVFTASEMSTYFVGNIYGNCYNGYFYNRTTTGYSFTILNDACNNNWRSTLVRYSASIDTSWPQSLHGSTYRFPTGFTGRLIETWNFSGSRATSDYALNGANTSITDPVTGYAGISGIYRVGPTGYTGGAGGQVYFQEFIIYDRKQISSIGIQDNIDQYFEVY
jgi:hypothetical protein